MNKRGKFAIEILIILIVVVITSAAIFSLVQSGLIEVKEKEEVSIIDMEFIPYVREGSLIIKDFKFCKEVGENYDCVEESRRFGKPGPVFFRFIIESTTVNGDVMLVENYRLRDAQGNVLLEVGGKDDFHLVAESDKEMQEIYFKDHLLVEEGDKEGKYILELVVENPLLNKKVTLIEGFEII